MAHINLRLPDELADKLEQETKLERRARSEIVRDALDSYLAGKSRERLMAEMVREARAVYGNPKNAEEARRIEEDFLPAENEALERTEDTSGGESGSGTTEKWWK